MFAKRKYQTKRQTKRPRRRIGRKKQILRPELEYPIPQELEKPTFDASGASPYQWMNIQSGIPQENPIKYPKHAKPFISLKQLCADVVAAHAECIAPWYLNEGWSCWQVVWESALRQGTDLPALFRMFAAAFGLEKNFRCHSRVEGTIDRFFGDVANLKRSALLACLVPSSIRHRIENIFANISITDFSDFVASATSCSVVLDCSRMSSFSNANMLALCKIKTVYAVDFSHNTAVDDQFLYNLNAVLVAGNSKIKILRVCGCPRVSAKAIRSLIQACDSSLLMYIEADVLLVPESILLSLFLNEPSYIENASIEGTRWRMIDEENSELAVAGNFSIATKLYYLLRVRRLWDCNGLIWDFKIFNKEAEQSMDIRTFNDIVWRQRLQRALLRKIGAPYIYMKNETLAIIPLVVDEKKSRSKRVPTTEKKKADKKSAKKKPKYKKTDAQSFFFGF